MCRYPVTGQSLDVILQMMSHPGFHRHLDLHLRRHHLRLHLLQHRRLLLQLLPTLCSSVTQLPKNIHML